MFERGRATLVLLLLAAPICAAEDPVLDLDKNTDIVVVPGSASALSPRLGVNIHSLNDEPALDAAYSAGFSFVRMDLPWASVEKNEKYDFSAYDHLLASLESRGMGMLWILDYGHPKHGGAEPGTPADLAAFGRYAETAATHFRGHSVRYEVWNEPNLGRFLPDPGLYSSILDVAISALRKGDPAAAISTGGISGFDFRFLRQFVPRLSGRRADAVAVHPYRTAAPETVQADLLRLRALVEGQFGRGMPIWDTEWGYSSAAFAAQAIYGDGHSEPARKRQAVLAVRELIMAWTLGLPVTVWYDLRDDGSDPLDPEANFGLLDQNGRDKPAMSAVRTLTAMAKGKLMGGLARLPAGLHALKVQDSGQVGFIIWCDQPYVAAKIRFVPRNMPSARNVTGREIRPETASGGAKVIRVQEADGPVYLRFPRP